MLGLGLENLSSNAGFETFTGDWNKAQKTRRGGNIIIMTIVSVKSVSGYVCDDV